MGIGTNPKQRVLIMSNNNPINDQEVKFGTALFTIHAALNGLANILDNMLLLEEKRRAALIAFIPIDKREAATSFESLYQQMQDNTKELIISSISTALKTIEEAINPSK